MTRRKIKYYEYGNGIPVKAVLETPEKYIGNGKFEDMDYDDFTKDSIEIEKHEFDELVVAFDEDDQDD